MLRRFLPACVLAFAITLLLAPSAVAAPSKKDKCDKAPKAAAPGADQGNGQKEGHHKQDERALSCLARSGQGVERADFNGDGVGDLAVGVPEENVGTVVDAGAVNVIYGSAGGLTDAGNQFLTQTAARPGGDPPEAGDAFGSALAAGDFNDDGRADLAVGAPGEDRSGASNSGNVMVFYGSATGLTAINPSGTTDVWTQGSTGVPGDPQTGDQFGFALTWGEFGHGAAADLAVGVPGETVLAGGFPRVAAGGVNIIYGSANGLAADSTSQLFTQAAIAIANPSIGDTAEAGDRFGSSLTAGKLGPEAGAGDDLVVGAPFENIGSVSNAGAIDALYRPSGGSAVISASGAQFIHQNSTGAEDAAEADDQFGATLATSGYQNPNNTNSPQGGHVVVGVPLEDVFVLAAERSFTDAGAAQSFALSLSGFISVDSDRIWTQGSPGCTGLCVAGDNTLADAPEDDDRFGSSLALNDFDGNGFKDLAIGAPFEDLPVGGFNASNAGAVHVLYARVGTVGHSGSNDQFFTQDTGTLLEEVGPGDKFGTALSGWNFGGGSNPDLAIGVPFDDIGDPIEPSAAETDVGVVNVLYSATPGRLSDVGNQLWHQGVGTILDDTEQGDHFGRVAY